jgi:hypothetical protein
MEMLEDMDEWKSQWDDSGQLYEKKIQAKDSEGSDNEKESDIDPAEVIKNAMKFGKDAAVFVMK